MGTQEGIQTIQSQPGYATSGAGRQYTRLGGTVPTSTTPTVPTTTQPITTTTTTPTPRPYTPAPNTSLSYPQSDLSNLAINSIFNPQPATGFQLNMSDFPFISNTPINISTPTVSAGSLNPGQFGANLGQNTATANLPPDIISMAQAQQALEGLLNPASLFNTMSGGPIVDEINQRTNQLQEAFRTQQMRNMDEGIAKIRSQLAAEGVLSGSDIINEQFDFTQGILNDIAVFDAGLGLENTKYLGDLAMQDLQMQSNNLQRVLVEANLQRGMNIQAAVADADRKSREIIAQAEIQARVAEANLQAQTQASIANAQIGSSSALAQAQIQAQREASNLAAAQALQLGQLQSQTQLGLGQMSAGVDILNLLANDFAQQQQNYLGQLGLPFNLIGGLTGPMSYTNSSTKSL